VIRAATAASCQIRVSTPADDPGIAALLVEAFVETYGRKMPEVVISERRRADLADIGPRRQHGIVLVSEINGQLVGTATVLEPGFPGTRAWTPNTAELRYLAVAPALQGAGRSLALLERAAEIAAGWRADALCLHVRREARSLERFYERRGWAREPRGDVDLLPEVYLEAYRLPLDGVLRR